jgi:hypothetical protein
MRTQIQKDAQFTLEYPLNGFLRFQRPAGSVGHPRTVALGKISVTDFRR